MYDEKNENESDEEYASYLRWLDSVANNYAYAKRAEDVQKRLGQCKEKAQDKFLKTLLLRSYVSDFMSEGKTPTEYQDADVRQAIEKQKTNVLVKSPFVLLTVNPRPTVSLKELQKSMSKFLNKKWLKGYFYVYEVRKADYSGLHCHILYQYNSRPYDMQKSVKTHFAKICDANNPNILNIKFIPEDILNDKVAYLLGNKKDKKQPGVIATVQYRTTNNISQYYDSSPLLPCRATAKPPVITVVET